MIFKLLQKKAFSDDEMVLYTIMLTVVGVVGALFAFYVVFFLVNGIPPVAIANAVGLLGCAVCFFCARARKYNTAWLLLSCMVVLYTLCLVYFVGGNNHSILYFFLLLLVQMVVPFRGRAVRITMLVLFFLGMGAAWLLDSFHTPVYQLGFAGQIMKLVNIVVGMAAAIVLFSLEKALHARVDKFSQTRMEELQDQAYIDPLTGLYNRRYAEVYFAQLVSQPSDVEICLAIADIDDFKRVNDTYGHEAGDVALQVVSDIFKNNTRKTDLVFRWGGEEFLLMIVDAKPADTYRLLDKIRVIMRTMPMSHGEEEFHLSVTIGMAPLDIQNISRSLEACDRKLYIGKKTGKDIVVM